MAITTSDIKKLKAVFATKDELEELKEELLKTFGKFKSEFFEKIDPILKEILASRDEREILSHRVSDHEDRITSLEQTLKN